MATNSFRIPSKSVNITTGGTGSESGDITVNSNKAEFHNGTTASPVVTEAHTATLTNKNLSDTTTAVVDVSDATKKIVFDAGGTTGTTTTLTAAQTANRVVTFPDATTTLTGNDASQTLSNKTLDNTNTINAKDTLFTIQDDGDATKLLKFQASGITTGTTRTLTAPDANTTITGTDATQTLTNKTLDNTNTVTLKDTLFTIQDDGDTSKQAKFQASGITTATTRTLTIPDANTTIVGTDATQTLTNKTLSGNTAVTLISGSGTLTLNTTGTITVPNATDTLVGKATTDTLSNKTFSDAITLSEIATPANPASNKEKIYTKSDGNLYILNSSGVETQIGSGTGGSKNYLGTVNNVNGNGNFELGSTTKWSLSHSTLDSTTKLPNQASGSWTSASGNLSISAVTSGKLAGTYSLQLVSSAATTAGDMFVSDAFTIDTEDQAKIITTKFYYSPTSGSTNANWSGTSSNSFGVAIYDVTNSTWIQPAGVFGMTQGSGIGYVTTTFQTTSNSTQYRLAVYNANATAGAITILLDDFSFSPQTAPLGAVVTDWISFTPTMVASNALTTDLGSYSDNGCKWRRVGDSMEVIMSVKSTTDRTNANSLVALIPTGYTPDSSKITGTVGHCIGSYLHIDASVPAYLTGEVSYDTTIATGVYFAGYSATTAATDTVGNWDNNDHYMIHYTIPITGWSSTVEMSNDTDTRVVAAKLTGTAGTQTFGAGLSIVTFATVEKDTHGALSSFQRFTAPVSGYYQAHASIVTTAGSATVAGSGYFADIKKNGTSIVEYGYAIQVAALSQYVSLAPHVGNTYLNAGDYLEVFIEKDTNAGAAAIASSAIRCFFEIERVSGPSVIAATESMNCRYKVPSGTLAAAYNLTTWGTAVYDSHGSYSSGLYTAKVSGKFSIKGNVFITGTSSVTTALIAMEVVKNSTVQKIVYTPGAATGSQEAGCSIDDEVDLLAGETLSIKTYTGMTGGPTFSSTSNSFFTVSRIGN